MWALSDSCHILKTNARERNKKSFQHMCQRTENALHYGFEKQSQDSIHFPELDKYYTKFWSCLSETRVVGLSPSNGMVSSWATSFALVNIMVMRGNGRSVCSILQFHSPIYDSERCQEEDLAWLLEERVVGRREMKGLIFFLKYGGGIEELEIIEERVPGTARSNKMAYSSCWLWG